LVYVCEFGTGKIREEGTEAAIPKIREGTRENLNTVVTTERGRNLSRSQVLLVSGLEAMARGDMTCEGEKTAREEVHTNRETGRRTTARWLGWSSIGRARVERTQTRKREREKVGPLLPAFGEAKRRDIS